MTLPSFYTESTLAAFMRASLKNVATDLGWTTDAPYAEPINDVLLAYGVSDLSAATDIAKLRALAKIEAWKAAMEATAGDVDTRSDTDEIKRSQVHAQAKAMFKQAQVDYQKLLNDRAAAANPGPPPLSAIRSQNVRVRGVQ